jgi:hypothetical protein
MSFPDVNGLLYAVRSNAARITMPRRPILIGRLFLQEFLHVRYAVAGGAS